MKTRVARSPLGTSKGKGGRVTRSRLGTPGDLRREPGEDRDLSEIHCHRVHPPKLPFFSKGTGTCCLEMSCNSGEKG